MFLLSSFRLHYTFETRVQIRLKSGLCELGQARAEINTPQETFKGTIFFIQRHPPTFSNWIQQPAMKTMYSSIDRRVPPTLNEESMIVITSIKLYDLHPWIRASS